MINQPPTSGGNRNQLTATIKPPNCQILFRSDNSAFTIYGGQTTERHHAAMTGGMRFRRHKNIRLEASCIQLRRSATTVIWASSRQQNQYIVAREPAIRRTGNPTQLPDENSAVNKQTDRYNMYNVETSVHRKGRRM